MEIKVETATIRLLDSLHEIEKQCFQEEAFSKQQIGYLLTDYNDINLIARADHSIAGFIIGRINIVRPETIGHIMTIDVAQPFRRKGIAERLMTEIEEIFKQKGAQESHLEVLEGNLAAFALYKKLGYRQISVLENYYGAAHGLYLKKPL